MFSLPYPISERKILFVALNWGDGHLMRSIPILKVLQNQNNQIHIIGTNRQLNQLKTYLSPYSSQVWEGFSVDFNGLNSFGVEILLKYPKWKNQLKDLQKKAEALIKAHKIDLILSDHIYGLHSKNIKSVFITHQLNYITPSLNCLVNKMHHKAVLRFDEIWLLDNEQSLLSGKMTAVGKTPPMKLFFVGWPSRFENKSSKDKKFITYLLTGPEPFRSQLLAQFEKQIDWSDSDSKLIGVNENYRVPQNSSVEVISSLEQVLLDNILVQSRIIHSRGGYSTFLDQQYLGFEMVNYPTAGQYEQIYLNQLHKKKASK
ncbi:MAG: hypothetical protein KJ941_06830 [Bacteroidetes bacterium]|nr:hypothetical protein [Bacteroidota bacterium]